MSERQYRNCPCCGFPVLVLTPARSPEGWPSEAIRHMKAIAIIESGYIATSTEYLGRKLSGAIWKQIEDILLAAPAASASGALVDRTLVARVLDSNRLGFRLHKDDVIALEQALSPGPIAAPASGAEQELIAELEKTNNEIIASDGDTCEYTAMVRDVLAIAKRATSSSPPGWRPLVERAIEAIEQGSTSVPVLECLKAALSSPSPPGWEEAREALEKLINKLDAISADESFHGYSYSDYKRELEAARAALRSLPAPSPSSAEPPPHGSYESLVFENSELRREIADLRESAPDAARPEIRAFALLMERELRANDPGWKNDSVAALARRVVEEAQELLDATVSGFPAVRYKTTIAEEAADVANMAMMVADVCGCLPPLSAPCPSRKE